MKAETRLLPGLVSRLLPSVSQRASCLAELVKGSTPQSGQSIKATFLMEIKVESRLGRHPKASTAVYHSKRKGTFASDTKPSKRLKTETPTLVPRMLESEVDELISSLPQCQILGQPNTRYTPEKAFGALKTYMDYVSNVLLAQSLGLPSARVEAWTQEALSLKDRFVPRTVIAVLGATGAGKSTLLNALLDCPDLLPADCMRACTSAPVELTYHEEDVYEADVFLLSEAEWRQEAQQLRSDIFNDAERDLAEDIENDLDEQIEVARAKFAAVHPEVPPEKLEETTIDEILQHSPIKKLLGKTIRITCPTIEEFAAGIVPYIDSKEGGEGPSQVRDANPKMWPLVKCVTCRVKSDILSTGAILVDLPGTQDVNHARAKIAQEYMKIADAYLIVAPIHRAVSDKVAQDLLGDVFKRQLLMDGGYNDSAVTFICTKTDQVVASEALRSLPSLKRDERIKQIASELKQLNEESQNDEKRHKEVQAILMNVTTERAKLHTELETLQRLLRGRSSKRTSSADDEALEISERIRVCTGKLHKISESSSQTDKEKQKLITRRQELQQQADALLKRQNNICAIARNNFAKAAIKKHFRAGRRQMDLDRDVRKSEQDAEDTAMNLAVFCASAHDYVRAKGLCGTNPRPVVFDDPFDTEIPQLRQHIKQMTWKGRNASIQKAIQLVEDFVRGIEVYLAAEGQTCSQDGEVVRRVCLQELSMLSKGWDSIIDRTCSTLRKELRTAISPKMNHGAKLAGRRALSTVEGFGDGTAWNTYRAHMVREGVYRENINTLLSDPIIKEVASAWRRAFDTGANGLFADLPKALMDKAGKTLDAIEDRAEESLRFRVRAVGRQQHKTIAIGLKGLIDTATGKIRELQREVSRQITPDIQYQLSEAYTDAGAQRGKACLSYMKTIMSTHVEINALRMFAYTADQTIDRINKLGEHVYHTMKAELDQLEAKVRLGFSGIWENMKATPEQILIRRAVRHRALQIVDITSQLLVLAKQANEAARRARATLPTPVASSSTARGSEEL